MTRFAFALAVMVHAAAAHGQVACPHSECALAVRPGRFAPPRLVQEATGETVAQVTPRGRELDRLLAASPEAVLRARGFQRDYLPGLFTRYAGVGFVLGGAYAAATRQPKTQYLVASAAGVPIFLLGQRRVRRATRALEAAVGAYNRSLPR